MTRIVIMLCVAAVLFLLTFALGVLLALWGVE